MFRRIFCLFCTVLLLAGTGPAVSESVPESSSYDFDLTFCLNADSFPELVRTRTAGYASLVNRLGLRGTASWSASTESFDLNAVLYFTDNPSLTYPFRMYGTKSRVFFTSPLINNETILLNMAALMEFSIKAKNTLGVPLPYAALLLPYTTESAFSGMIDAWQKVIGSFSESGEVSVSQFMELSDLFADQLLNNGLLQLWISGVAGGSDFPSTVEVEINNLPWYYENVTGNLPVTVTVSPGSEIWTNASGDTLFSRCESDGMKSLLLSLPASGNGYVPLLSYVSQVRDQTVSFVVDASIRRDASAVQDAVSPEEDPDSDDTYDDYVSDDEYDSYDSDDTYDEYDGFEDEDDQEWSLSEDELPELMLSFHADGTGLPCMLPCDASFTVSVSVLGALYPECAFCVTGETKKDGSVILSLSYPVSGNTVPVEVFRCAGTVVPSAQPKDVPDYMHESLEGVYNVFSFNEQKLAVFNSKVLPPLVRSVFSFVAAAPTSACQSFLDDLTEIGILDILID